MSPRRREASRCDAPFLADDDGINVSVRAVDTRHSKRNTRAEFVRGMTSAPRRAKRAREATSAVNEDAARVQKSQIARPGARANARAAHAPRAKKMKTAERKTPHVPLVLTATHARVRTLEVRGDATVHGLNQMMISTTLKRRVTTDECARARFRHAGDD